jgi:hypothetical protein
MAAVMTEQPSWASGPSEGPYADDHAQDQALPDQGPAQANISEMTGMLRDTRGNMLLGGGVLSAITISIVLEAELSPRVLRPGTAGVLNSGNEI